jgi:hypothetical protein
MPQNYAGPSLQCNSGKEENTRRFWPLRLKVAACDIVENQIHVQTKKIAQLQVKTLLWGVFHLKQIILGPIKLHRLGPLNRQLIPRLKCLVKDLWIKAEKGDIL